MPNRFYSPDQQFLNNSGAPYAGGFLYFYASQTSTPLATYQDEALTIANAFPIVLDSNGQAGSIFLQNLAYKVVLTDSNNNQVWTEDPVYTSDFSTQAQFQIYLGNPNGFVAGNQGSYGGVPASVVWDAVDQLLYVATTTGTAATTVWTAINAIPTGLIPAGVVQAYGGFSAPIGWLLCGGQAVSRATYSALFGVIGTVYGPGDGITTFNVPDLRGSIPAGQDTMVQGAANRLTTAGSGVNGAVLGAAGGSQNQTLPSSALPNTPLNVSVTIGAGQGAHDHTINYAISAQSGSSTLVVTYPLGSGADVASTSTNTLPAMSGSGSTSSINGGVAQTATTTVPPVVIFTYIIKT
jgi:microcystin-dependent protein